MEKVRMEKVKIIITAPTGKLGKLIVLQALDREDIKVIGGLGRRGAAYIGEDLGTLTGYGRETGAVVHGHLDSIIEEADMVVDFSQVDLSMEVLDSCLRYKKALVCGTTGFSQEQIEKIHRASEEIPLMYAANTSKAVNLMNHILELIAKNLGDQSQVDIIEMHDKLKLDAPSGTSLEMGETIAQAMGLDFEKSIQYGKEGRGIREDDKIVYHSIRSGDISSSHKVIFGLMGERMEIVHHAHNWNCFAKGALDCAAFMHKKTKGLYSVQDIMSF